MGCFQSKYILSIIAEINVRSLNRFPEGIFKYVILEAKMTQSVAVKTLKLIQPV